MLSSIVLKVLLMVDPQTPIHPSKSSSNALSSNSPSIPPTKLIHVSGLALTTSYCEGDIFLLIGL